MRHALPVLQLIRALAFGVITVLPCGLSQAQVPEEVLRAVVTDESVAFLRVNATLPAPTKQLTVLRDLVLTDSEGVKSRVLDFTLSGSTVRIEADKGRIVRMSVIDGNLATRDGLRVGTPASKLANLPGVQVLVGDGGALWVVSNMHCGLSFQLDYEPDYSKLEAPPTDAAGLRKLPTSAAIKSILVRGCKSHVSRN